MTSRSRDRGLLSIQRREFATAGGVVDPTVNDSRGISQLHGRRRSGDLSVKGDAAGVRIEDHDPRDILWRVSAVRASFRRHIEGVGEPRTIGRGEGGLLSIDFHTSQRSDVAFMRGLLQIRCGEGPRGLPCRGVQAINSAIGDDDRTAHSGKDLLHISLFERDSPDRDCGSWLILTGIRRHQFLYSRNPLMTRQSVCRHMDEWIKAFVDDRRCCHGERRSSRHTDRPQSQTPGVLACALPTVTLPSLIMLSFSG